MSTPMTTSIKNLAYEDLNGEIKRTMRRSARDAVQLGFMLRRMVDEKLWESAYSCFDEYLDNELHMDYSMANRFININKKYSLWGSSMEISENYESYSQGLLMEMLSMPPELEEKVTPDMTVKQAREIKKQAKKEKEPEPVKEDVVIDGEYREVREPENIATSQIKEKDSAEHCAAYKAHRSCDGCYYDSNERCPYDRTSIEKLSPYGMPKTVYPEGSPLSTVGCGHKYDCFDCAKECNIRQEKRYCVDAPLGNPFECITMNVLPNLRQEFPEQCQFINEDLASHRQGDNQPSPCCKECSVAECGYRCWRAINLQPEAEEPVATDGLQRVRGLLEEKKHDLEAWMRVAKVEEVPENIIFEKKTIVGALASMVYELESVKEEPDPVPQPELPVLKNNEQRKEWLGNYKSWGLWYRDENIDVNYYKFDFEDGSRLIVSEYPNRHCYWNDELKDETYYHLLEKNKKSYKKKYDEVFRHSADSETYLVDFLKNLQKKGK